MPDPTDPIIAAIRDRMAHALHKITHCANQLSDDKLWHRQRPELNSIANLLLHLSGNIRQWIISGIGGAKDTRNRPKEFSDRSQRTRAQLLEILNNTVNEADGVLSRLDAAALVSRRKIQGFDVDVAGAAIKTVAHFVGHSQEIIFMTRLLLADKYKFDFVPHGAEQEAASGVGI